MNDQKILRTLATVLGFATATAAVTLAVCAPRTTFADGPDVDRMGEWTDDGTKFDDIVVNGTVGRDVHSKTGWLVVIKARNEGDNPETMLLETDMDRDFVTPESRANEPATTVYSQNESITIPAHGTFATSRPVPAWVVPQLETAERIQNARTRAQATLEKATDDKPVPEEVSSVLRAQYPSFKVGFLRGVEKTNGSGGPARAPAAAPEVMPAAPQPPGIAKAPAAAVPAPGALAPAAAAVPVPAPSAPPPSLANAAPTPAPAAAM